MTETVAIAVPTIPPRRALLAECVDSIHAQTRPVHSVCIAIDNDHAGAWHTRNRALRAALATGADWVGFVDDDDTLLPCHVEHLLYCAEATGADLVWGWFEVIGGGRDPWPQNRGRQWEPQDLSIDEHMFVVPITYLARAELISAAVERTGGFHVDEKNWGSWALQDFPLFDSMARNGKPFASAETTWCWRHHGVGKPGNPGNTSGLGSRW